MTLTVEAPTTLPFTTPCTRTGNFPGEYSETLRWECQRLIDHDGDCIPDDLSQRLYQRRVDVRAHYEIPEEVHLNAEMLRHVINIATSEASDSDGLDSGVMWLRIRYYIAFANFLRLVCP